MKKFTNELLKNLIQNPVEEYVKLRNKLYRNGVLDYNTPMYELHSIIDNLTANLDRPFVKAFCNLSQNKALKVYRNICITKLSQLKIKYIDDTKGEDKDDQNKAYPHSIIINDSIPYGSAMATILEVVTFFDVLERVTKKLKLQKMQSQDNDAPITINDLPDLYHTDRYFHYVNTQLFNRDNKDFIHLPVTDTLSFRDLIMLRAIPLGICGVSDKTVFVDAYANTPLDFYVHDFNHSRRFRSFNDIYFNKHGVKTDDLEKKVEIYKEFQSFLETYVLQPTSTLKKLGLTYEEKSKRQIMTVLYFELFHEYAFTPDRDSVIDAFKFSPGSKAPFEVMKVSDETPVSEEEINKRRLNNFNLQSGVATTLENNKHSDITIHYIFDKGPNFLTSAYNKLTNQFYDNTDNPLRNLPPMAQRTPELIADAALQIIKDLGIESRLSDVTRNGLIDIIKNKNCLESYANTKTKIVVDPVVAEQVINSERPKQLLFRSVSNGKVNASNSSVNRGDSNYLSMPQKVSRSRSLMLPI